MKLNDLVVLVVVVLQISIPATLSAAAEATVNANLTAQLPTISLGEYDLFVIRNTDRLTQSVVLYSSSSQYTPLAIPITLKDTANKPIKFLCGTVDLRTNSIYIGGDGGVIAMLNLTTGEQSFLVNTNSSKITSIQHMNNTLCWIGGNKELTCMDLTTRWTRQVIKTEERDLVISMTGFNGTLYYTYWPRSSPQSIYKHEVEQNKTTLVSSHLYQPHSLVHYGNNLYYVHHPPGVYVVIKKLDTTVASPDTTVYRQPHKRVKSLAMACSTAQLHWSDGGSRKVLWRVDDYGDDHEVVELGRGVVSVFGRECSSNEVVQDRDEIEMLDSTGDAPVAVVNEVVSTAAPSTTTTPVTTTTDSSLKAEMIRMCTVVESNSIECDQTCIWISKPTCLAQVHEHHPSNTALLSTSPPSNTDSTWPPYMIVLISVLSTVAVVMSLLSVYLTIRVRKLSRKPVIRRRYVVSRSTSESDARAPTNVREMIDIENCCNMNVCETPCYERTLLQPTTNSSITASSSTVISVNSSNSSWGNCSKKDDKRCLIR